MFFLLLLSDEMRPKFPTHNFLRFSSSCILKVNKLLSRNEQVSLASFFFHFSLFLWLCDELCAAHFISIEYYRKLAYKYTRLFFCFWLRSLEGWFLIALSLQSETSIRFKKWLTFLTVCVGLDFWNRFNQSNRHRCGIRRQIDKHEKTTKKMNFDRYRFRLFRHMKID